ncbi:PAS domain S-box protein [bacterium]|nr:PAS domain S-box protein [bacterium]
MPEWFRFTTLYLLFLLLFWQTGTVIGQEKRPAPEETTSNKRVLLLNSYHEGYLWTDQITEALIDGLASDSVSLHIEYMDSKRHVGSDYQVLLRNILIAKHRKTHYDVVITTDNLAFEFYKSYGEQIFGDAPLVCCGVNYLTFNDMYRLKNATGISEEVNLIDNFKLIKRLHPSVNRTLVISDMTNTGKRIQEEVDRIVREIGDELPEIEQISDVTIHELIDRLQNLDPNTVVLHTLFTRDNKGQFFEFDEGTRLICDNSAVPVYGTWNFELGHGIVGGLLVDGYDMGLAVAEIAQEVLAGTPAGDIPVRYETPTAYQFDYRQLREFNISESQLPDDSEVLFGPVTFYRQYKTLIWNLGAAFLMLATALVGVTYGLVRTNQSRRELFHNEQNLRTTLMSIGDAVITTDTEGRVTRMNPVAETLTGWTQAEADGKPLEDVFNIIHAITRKPADNPVQAVLEKNDIIGLNNHTKLIAKGGKEYQIADSAAPIRAMDGSLEGVVLVFRDVTEEYQLQKRLQDNEAFLTNIYESIQDGIMVLDTNLTVLWVNGTMQEWYKNESALTGKRCATCFTGTQEVEGCATRRCMISKKTETSIVRGVPGTKHDWFEVFSYPIVRESGEIIGVVEFVRDVTKRMQIESALRTSEMKLRTIIEQSNDAIYILYNNKFDIINQKFTQLTGVTISDVNKPDFSFMDYVDPKDRPMIESRIKTREKGERTSDMYEFTILHKDGSRREVQVSVSEIDYRDGIAVLGILRDITNQKELERQLLQSQKIESIGHLAGGIAHDFNNLLTPIIGNSEMALMSMDPDSPFYDDIREINITATKAADLTRKLLAYSRKQVLSIALVNLNTLIQDFETILLRTIRENIELEFSYDEHIMMIRVDKPQVEQILMNLSINAQDAMPNGGRISIETRTEQIDTESAGIHAEIEPGTYTLLTVSDTGEGMDEETKARIFDPFFTTKEVGQGSGLGLSTVYGIVKQHNGHIWVYSEPKTGTVFKIYFPAVEAEPEMQTVSFVESAAQQPSASILLVEDQDDVRSTTKKMLEFQGHTVYPAESGEKAIQIYEEQGSQIDLLLTDVIMPGLNGSDLYKTLKQFNDGLKVIFMSGYDNDIISYHGILDDGIRFINKPITLKSLVDSINEVLNET